MNVPKNQFIILAILIVLSFLFRVLISFPLKVHIFLTLELIQLFVIAYLVYTFFELKVLNEKQGSKLAKSKQKLYSSWD